MRVFWDAIPGIGTALSPSGGDVFAGATSGKDREGVSIRCRAPSPVPFG